jgi:hypothetical protein
MIISMLKIHDKTNRFDDEARILCEPSLTGVEQQPRRENSTGGGAILVPASRGIGVRHESGWKICSLVGFFSPKD